MKTTGNYSSYICKGFIKIESSVDFEWKIIGNIL